MRRHINMGIGLIFLIPGLFILLDFFNIFKIREYIDFTYLFKNYWAIIFFVVPGIIAHLFFFANGKKYPVMLFNASILVTSGLVLHFSYRFVMWKKLWAFFILSIAVAVFEIFLFSGKERNTLIISVIIAGISGVFISKSLIGNYYGYYILGIVLILLGLIFIFVNNTKRAKI